MSKAKLRAEQERISELAETILDELLAQGWTFSEETADKAWNEAYDEYMRENKR